MIRRAAAVLLLIGGLAALIAGSQTGLPDAIALYVTGGVLALGGVLLWWLAGLLSGLPKRPSMRESLRTSSAAMQMFADQATKETRLRRDGRRTVVTVVAAEDTGIMINQMPVIDLTLEVPGGPSTIAQVRTPVPHVALVSLSPGSRVVAFLDRDDPTDLVVAWTEQPSPFDAEA